VWVWVLTGSVDWEWCVCCVLYRSLEVEVDDWEVRALGELQAQDPGANMPEGYAP
jgi:hypothetical protein